MGPVANLRGRDGKNYTVSTAQKFDSWETAVFQAGFFGVIAGKGMCFAEVVLGDQPGQALLAHARVSGMVELVPRSAWEMSPAAIHVQQTYAVEYVTADAHIKPLLLRDPPDSPSEATLREQNAYGPGTGPLLDWIERMLLLDEKEWAPIIRAAYADHGWADPTTFRIAAEVVERDPAMRIGITMAAGANGMGAAHSGAQDEQTAGYVLGIARNAAVALLTRHAIPEEVFRRLYAPFAGVLDV